MIAKRQFSSVTMYISIEHVEHRNEHLNGCKYPTGHYAKVYIPFCISGISRANVT